MIGPEFERGRNEEQPSLFAGDELNYIHFVPVICPILTKIVITRT